ncbi:FtsK/SpoIIIE family DNA translocase [Candidatus Similichlamydia epinepheli]|uniref:FtsK/SpoIIIE family DNA translocase n=1 Tax=Candidatus Similichlamydia epinepheli TaxID=1903953 RepID=UPI000D343B6E|nr:DNA translocase FtsK [Candidatus Similichlamydia epinepheli]
MSEKSKEHSPRGLKEVKGFLLASFGTLFFLSLISFSPPPESANWLGLVGFCTAFVSRFLLGLLAYPIPISLCYLGWKIGRHHLDVNIPSKLQISMVVLATFSSSLVLSVLSENLTTFTSFAAPWSSYSSELNYTPLGGLPVFFIYKLMPFFNLALLFGPIGSALLGTLGVFFCSGFFIYQVGVKKFIEKMKRKNAQTVYFLEKSALCVGKTCHVTGCFLLSNLYRIPVRKGCRIIKKTSLSILDTLFLVTRRSLIGISVTIKGKPFSAKPHPALIKEEAKIFAPILQIQHVSPSYDSFGTQELSDYIEKSNITAGSTYHKEEVAPPIFEQSKEETLGKDPSIFLEPNSFESSPNSETASIPVPIFTQTSYQLPHCSLLKEPSSEIDKQDQILALREEASRLENVLRTFAIEAKVGEVYQGARITSFEVHPATGVKVQRIKAIERDIALNMEAKSIRILAPIPGKAAVGVEIPSLYIRHVNLRSLLEGYLGQETSMEIPLLLGEMISGEQVVVDLAKMPHLIVAGATGSGKSVCINSIIMSILMTRTPDQVRLLMIDPKKVELSCYTPLPHLIAPVITETQGAKEAFNWLIREMEWRYEILRRLGLRHIRNFNERAPNENESELLGVDVPNKMYFIVAIVDELADLMMTSSTPDIECSITRIAQKARAVGIHLVLATQRPSREVITGLIKANFPARIAFKVSNRVNSQIILDMVGADELLGNGDMLFLSPNHPHPIRAQGAYVQEEEIRSVIDFISQRTSPNYIVSSFDEHISEHGGTRLGADRLEDVLYDQAVRIIIETGVASTTSLQRRLKIGYPRAASLIDEMERQGVVSQQDGSKQRKILIGKGDFTSHSLKDPDEF